MMRIFIMTLMVRPDQPSGGPGGVNYRLEKANNRYHYLKNVFHIYFNSISWEEGILTIPEIGEDTYAKISSIFKRLNSIFAFNEEDVFIYHDVHSAYFAQHLGLPQKRSLLIYHGQGSLYNEYRFSNPESLEEKQFLDGMTESAMTRSKRVGFPSVGAMEALIKTEQAVEQILDNKNVDILYNGCDVANDSGVPRAVDSETWESICCCPYELKFISVANLVEAKGIDRLPGFFSCLKKRCNFLWVIVGDGPQNGLISELIKEKEIEENVVWIRNRIPNSDILKLMREVDFYIMGHRTSIFDFSTIEAMHMGNIPVLTCVEGNKEMIIDNNGFFLTGDNELDAGNFYEITKIMDILAMKKRNIDIAKNLFSEEAFLTRYEDVVKCLIEE